MKQPAFSKTLLKWYAANYRELPWKNQNAYATWLSEVILQQTRVEQGTPYYLAFIKQYPTIHDLANANEETVLKLWQGLGYYSRARNLLRTAKAIVDEHNGQFPNDYEQLLRLKGIGPYTAAAIASFAYHLPHAVVDGNVYRVLSRVFGIETPIDSTAGKKEFTALAQQLLSKEDPASYNQAIMNFGALVCLPKLPKCDKCCFAKTCFAANHQLTAVLPVKEKKTKVSTRYFHFIVLQQKRGVYIQQRTGKGIWEKLYQFPLIETTQDMEFTALKNKQLKPFFQTHFKQAVPELLFKSTLIKHQLSHQTIYARFYHFEAESKTSAFKLIQLADLEHYAFPRLIAAYLEEAPGLGFEKGRQKKRPSYRQPF